ncbi:hypothetical protein AOT82_2049 [Psychrobacter sp. AntiMn-1]|nr:hypothetical protein AOT82_2049 [Psychrobacter sp. AntiMn-1]
MKIDHFYEVFKSCAVALLMLANGLYFQVKVNQNFTWQNKALSAKIPPPTSRQIEV